MNQIQTYAVLSMMILSKTQNHNMETELNNFDFMNMTGERLHIETRSRKYDKLCMKSTFYVEKYQH